MARALQDILTELNSVYNPQRQAQNDIYNKGIAATEPQQQADLAGLEAAKKDSFGQIETGANRRGMFFSGIPLAEQAKYVGQNYLPSVANLQNRYASIKGNLYQTLAESLGGIDTNQRKFAQDIYGQEVNADIQREQIAAQERARAASAAAGSGIFSPGGGAVGGNVAPSQSGGKTLGAVSINPADQQLYNQMFIQGNGSAWDNQSLVNDYNATLQSARYGNARDIQKIQFYHSFRPDLFGATQPSLSNATNAGSGGGGF